MTFISQSVTINRFNSGSMWPINKEDKHRN